MFTGIITATTPVIESSQTDDGLEMVFKTPAGWDDIVIGESIATNGICLTVTEKTKDSYTVFLMPETLELTSFNKQLPSVVNLERALQIGERLSGHIVQGHVDCVGQVRKITTDDGYRIYINFPEKFRKLVITKGSITIDGVSLTVASVSGNTFSVAIIPHTLAETTLGKLKVNDLVNLEFDIIGKYAINSLKDTTYAKS